MKQIELIERRIKFQHLNVVRAVAQQGSMGKAAKHLAVSQPVVSKVVAELEEMLGVSLFDRSRHGVELTLYGRALLKRSIRPFDELKATVEEVAFLADPTVGELRIGSADYLISGLGAAVMDRMWQRFPRIAFQVVQADAATLINHDLPERRIELAIVPLLRPSIREDLEATILFEDHLRVVVGIKSRWARRRTISLAELCEEPWCVTPSAVGSLIAESFRACSLEMPRIAVATASAQLGLQMVESGRFVGHCGDATLSFFTHRFAVKKLPIDLPVPPFAVAIVALKDKTLSPLAQLFIDCAREVVGPLARRRSSPVRAEGNKSRGKRSKSK